ncbi:MAG TPA: YceI family protein [Polyangiaceae bacterium]
MTFKSTGIEAKGGTDFVVRGDLTIRGVTKPVALEVEYLGTSKNPYGKTVAGFSARGTVDRKDYGVAFNAILETGGVAVGEKVKLEVDVEVDVEATLAEG